MKNKTPFVSVVIPVYNTEKYIWEALESIIMQSFWDFECIVIDDYSTDDTYKKCLSYAQKDNRIKCFQNEKNIWVVKTRNRLLSYINPKSKYIAIMDADDISHPHRLEEQVLYLEKNISYSIVGSHTSIIDELSKKIRVRKYPERHKEVSKTIFEKSPLAQPAVMIRKKDLEQVWLYNEKFERCQDYELWCRFFDAGYKIWNIQKELLFYRVFSQQGKSKHLKLTLKNTLKIQRKYIFQKKYFSIIYLIHFILKVILLVFPNSLILYLFKKIEYKNA